MQIFKENLTWAAKPKIFSQARMLRKEMTKAETHLWKRLRGKKLKGMKFRRQHPIDIFIADFYCHERKLIIELDGDYHDSMEQKEYDEGRSYELREKGFTILRFRNEAVINDIEKVLGIILKAGK